MNILAVFATAAEGARLAQSNARCLETGVGKAAAAAAVAVELCRGPLPEAVLLFGVAGAYPDRHLGGRRGLTVGELCLVGEDCLADEGVETETGFQGLGALGLQQDGLLAAEPALTARAALLLGNPPVVRGATVSTCSATEERSLVLARRTGALLESMEGAAVALACRRFGVPLIHVRCISNLTGDRSRADWRLAAAAAAACDAAGQLLRCLE